MKHSLLSASALMLLAVVGTAQAAHDPFPEIRLPKKEYKGQDAVDALAPYLAKVAGHYQMRGSELKTLLRQDAALRVNDRGLLRYAENIDLTQTPFNPSPDVIPDADTFRLHSRPGAAGVVYLSFRGTTVSGTSWNVNGDIVAAPYSFDADPAMSAAELREIRSIWLRVAEDYAPFNVDVTTEATAATKSVEIIVTPSWEWYGQSGGVCYVGNFTWVGERRVCWVFSSLLNNNTKNVSEAASHEAGHSFGLRHWAQYDPSTGSLLSSYYWGAGDWCPIMGAGYNRPITTWSKGEYLGAGTLGLGTYQDDSAKISGIAGYAADEAGGTLSSTARMNRITDSGGTMLIQHRGIVSTSADRDVYRLDTLGGDVHLTVAPALVTSNLDFKVRFLNGQGVVLFESDPYEIAAVAVDGYGLAAGTYYLEVSSVGYGDPYGTGYSAYGSAGQYFVSGTYLADSTDGGNPPPSNPPPPPPATPPVVQITAPAQGTSVQKRQTFTITAHASDDATVTTVKILAGGKVVCTRSVSAADVSVSCSATAPNKTGTLSLAAVATDASGTSTQSAPVSITVTR